MTLSSEWKIQNLLSRDGEEKIRVATYARKPKLVERWIVFVNGRSEYIEKYPHLPSHLELDDKTGLLTWDHRGQGSSSGSRSHIDDYQQFVKDLEFVVQKFCEEKPYMMIAHSMGGLIALRALLAGVANPTRLVMCAPLLKLPPKPVPHAISRPLSQALSRLGLGKTSTRAGTSDREIPFAGNRYTACIDTFQRLIENQPHCPGTSFGWVNASFDAIDFVFAEDNLKKLKTPVLLLCGSREEVVDPQGVSAWTQLATKMHPNLDIRYKKIVGARHELFSEIDKYRDVTVKYIKEFAPEYYHSVKILSRSHVA